METPILHNMNIKSQKFTFKLNNNKIIKLLSSNNSQPVVGNHVNLNFLVLKFQQQQQQQQKSFKP